MRYLPGLPFVATAFLLQLMREHGARALNVQTAYDKKYALLKTVSKNDRFWNFVLAQTVYVKLDNKRFRKIIENELLKDARVVNAEAGELVGEPVNPEIFLNNVMKSNRKRIGTVLDVAVDVLRTAFVCLTYKDMVRLMALIKKEVTGKIAPEKLAKRSNLIKSLVKSILAKMSAMQFTDKLLLNIVNLLWFFSNNKYANHYHKYDYMLVLEKIVKDMKAYVKGNCANATQEIAVDPNLVRMEDTINSPNFQLINEGELKNMYKSFVADTQQHFDKLRVDFGIRDRVWESVFRIETIVDDERQ